MRSSFEVGAVSIATTVHGTPACRAAYATPWPALPALIVHTPRLALRLGQHRDRVGCAAQFVRVDRLQVLELEADVRVAGPEIEAHQRRAHDGLRDALARFLNIGERDRAHRGQWLRHDRWILGVDGLRERLQSKSYTAPRRCDADSERLP